MKKKLLAMLLCVCMTASLVACGGSEPAESTEVSENTETETDEPEAEAEEEAEEEEEQASLMGFNMVKDGDFSQGEENWFLYLNAGSATMSYDNEELSVNITSVGKEEHGVQIYYDGFTLETGCVYEIQFDASSTVERTIQYRSQINGGDYHPYNSEYLTLTPETQHFDIQLQWKKAAIRHPDCV